MPGGGILKIATENVEIRETSTTQHRGVPPGRYAVLTVSDSGAGMSAATQARLFDPFFTSKEARRGTGLGLAVVRSIVAQSGGYVTVQSELGRGSTFKVFLPVVEQTEQAQAEKQTEEVGPRGSETVLLVEAAQGVRIVIRDYLESGGYFVDRNHLISLAFECSLKQPTGYGLSSHNTGWSLSTRVSSSAGFTATCEERLLCWAIAHFLYVSC